ncbi:ABC-type antimicrobial peptide transport system, ATPase component [Frankia casuarinae]|uniref:ABC transporter related n=1 Tax=Frankia casuarinae (strain DSM 45818 / CECT 9043 / HFP020203 / CcI3) TaxID=106370 RepID=Q2J9P5_FRACC|nr:MULTISPECIES: ABC transporter ATP-binding protein [Frankia]ABD11997.1 ABC transporter related [Frankia casuarinae]ETA01860.1 ABC-type antimicrobial peptide transport system, ATPase component [Frankia sp. CcI6]EYT92529.1 ABC-type antimicrobial peptide transport system, ATPase component [Frankia casuarinae]KFB04474.1 ABC-type antimicrobial peptide transport system, ATPase component [Frankia sp. Allo2]OAA24315.1 putative ABC transport system ATP-binding protein [Frankia casuarinae]
MARRTGSSRGGKRGAVAGSPPGREDRGSRPGEYGAGRDGRVPEHPGGRREDGPDAAPAARAARLTKVYGSGDTTVTALREIDLAFPRGRFTAIMGPSGSGKSTLMHCLAGLDTVTRGRVFIGNVDLSRLSDKQLTRLRRDRIGFIFQQFNLLPTLTAAENITLPLSIAGRSPDRAWMRTVIDAVGLAPRLKHRPSELSGGQQQRVACARALVTRPEIIFADEPTGNLDSRSGAEVLSFLRDSVSELGQTIVMVTHDATAASYSDEVIFLADGRLVDAIANPTAEEVLDRMKHLDAAAGGLAADGEIADDRDDHNDTDGRYGPAGDYDDYAYPDQAYPDQAYPDQAYPDQPTYGRDEHDPYQGHYPERRTGQFEAIPAPDLGPDAGGQPASRRVGGTRHGEEYYSGRSHHRPVPRPGGGPPLTDPGRVDGGGDSYHPDGTEPAGWA